MNKLYIACAMLVPLVGCSVATGDNSSEFSGTASGGLNAGGSTGLGADLSGNASGGPSANPDANAASGPGASGGASAGVSAGAGSGPSPSSSVGSGGGRPVGPGISSGGSSSGATCSAAVLPATVQAMITNKCATCHGSTPLPGLPSLVSYATLTAPAKSDPSKTNAVVALARIQATSMPMPPAPGAPVSASDVKALQDFIAQGYPKPSCTTGAGGSDAGGNGAVGSGAGGGAPSTDPLFAMPICTSKSTWNGGNEGSASMNPGMACNTCHRSSEEAPIFSIAGTVYPTGHEPDRCNSSVGTAGAKIVIIGADGKMVTLTPSGVGNFSSNTAIKTPFQAKVTYQGRERLMLTPQTSGDCNSCHSQNGNTAAPGRITIP